MPRVSIEVRPRDWAGFRKQLLRLTGIGAFSVLLGLRYFGFALFVVVAIVTAVALCLTSWLLGRVQIHQVGGATAYVFPASLGRRAGRLRIDASGASWWSYSERKGDPEWHGSWDVVERVAVQSRPALAPICQVSILTTSGSETDFVLSMVSRRAERLLGEVLQLRV